MSGKFVRASKFRHVHGEPARKDKCYLNVRPNCNNESNYIKGNATFLAFAAAGGGGGPVIVHPLSQIGRLDHTPPSVTVHKGNVTDIDFSPFLDTLMATGSEDCTVKITVLPEGGLTGVLDQAAASLDGHQKKILTIHFHPTANNILGSTAFDNTLKIWDIQTQQAVLNEDLPDLPTSFEWNGNGSQIVTACKDKKIRVFDPRQQGSAITTESFSGVKSSKAVWASNFGWVAGFGFSNNNSRQYALWDPRKFDEPLTRNDIDQSAGVMMPFYDPDTSMLYVGGKGETSIKYYEITEEAPYIHFLTEYRDNEPQRGLAMLPKRAVDVNSCEVARFLRLMNDYIVPIAFHVPRKSDMFQADLYPDTYAGVPALSEAEWLSGKDKDAPKVSMKPGASSAAPEAKKAAFVAQKSAAELQKELAEAHARIAELEAELKKLKAQ